MRIIEWMRRPLPQDNHGCSSRLNSVGPEECSGKLEESNKRKALSIGGEPEGVRWKAFVFSATRPRFWDGA